MLFRSLHFLKHCALALASAALAPAFRWRGLWLLLSLAWMPALGWLLAGLPWFGVTLARVGLAALAAWVGWAGNRRLPRRIPQ